VASASNLRAMDPPTCRVLIIASHPVISGLVQLASGALPHADVIGDSSSVADARVALETLKPDVVVLDLDLPDGNGHVLLEEAQRIRSQSDTGAPRVLVLSDRHDGATVLGALRFGAAGFLTKSDGLRGLTAALSKVAAGERVVPPSLESLAAAELGRSARRSRERAVIENALTDRQREILLYLAEGLTLQQIGRRLAISPRTVEAHARDVYRKLGVRTRLQAVSKAAAVGLIDLH
jgi:DNA-binding NarL/FixJ family response regulator